ncbi:protein GAMETE EXPRESSED 1-like [Neltuma alba]|uniref:protein GAMETE EXPRESSED 1-like n=1 Tax=Neltuma alba TaxID=207710 RepID=UPI0010A4DB3F|nr:protein GAMETE EXPRESSED 1-like [Prosopis alba]
MGGNHGRLMVFIVLCFFTRSESWNWFSSLSSTSGRTHCGSNTVRGSVAEYSAEGLNDERGIKLVENAKEKMVRSNWCWQNAYKNVFAGCSEILADEEKRSRLAWHLSDCFQRDSGRPHFPHCDAKSPMSSCLKALDDLAHKVYLEFYLETNTICHQLQAHAFKHETERLITGLKISAHTSYEGFDEEFREHIFEQGKKIADSQLQFAEVQEDMKMRFKEGIEILKESQNNLGEEIGKIRDESIEIQKEIIKVGDTVSQEMQSLHSKTENIVHLAAISLDKQQHLIHGQSKALDNLNSLSEFQSKALTKQRLTFQQLAEFGQRHHQELLLRQEQVQGLHDRLMTNSKSILAAQESFESKQASMFAALDKIFSLQNAMFVESRMIKAFIVYFVSIFVIYMLTSTKQTYNTRPWLYIGLCVVFLMEISIVRFTSGNIEQQACIISIIRSVFMIIASAQLIYAIFTYRDYEVLNFHLLRDLVDRVTIMEQQKKKLAWVMDEEEEEDLEWSRWIDTDLPEEVNCIEDPDFIFPEEEVGENSITVSSRKYNLRSRRSHYG